MTDSQAQSQAAPPVPVRMPTEDLLDWVARLTGKATAAHRVTLPDFMLLTAQLGLILLVVAAFRLEEAHSFETLLPVIFAGFVVNCWLPLAWRPAFQVCLTLGSALLLFGAANGAILVGVGLGLVALCHLPAPMAWRIVLILAATAALALVRLERFGVEWGPTVLPILGSIFMFRLIVYLYDLRNERAEVSAWHRLGYFFMLPNVCFPLFPIVDWTAFHRGYYRTEAREIYQKGLRLILRGVTHLLLYRVIYTWVVPPPAEVADLNGLLVFLVSSWALYLRISGLFHVIGGILALFGYDLPPTHDRYFLASGFNDLWRRANIYWKDFMTKVFYYPLVMRVQHLGMARALALTMIPLFAATWLLHSWQWFWIRGEFPLRTIDAVFWMTFGLLVLANSLIQLRSGRERALKKNTWSTRRALVRSTKVVAMFLTTCVGWSFFISPTVADWLSLMGTATNASAADLVRIAAVLAGVLAAGVAAQYLATRWERPSLGDRTGARSSGLVVAAASVALLLPTLPAAQPALGVRTAGLVMALRGGGLNEGDHELIDRGYYESLMEPPSFVTGVWEVEREKPRLWANMRRKGAVRPTDDIMMEEFVPSTQIVFKDHPLTINSLGMRDREYTLEPPEGVHRAALLGGSFAMGSGVGDGETFEAIVEDRLNSEAPSGHAGFEILNFSKGGRKAIQKLYFLEKGVLDFQPDVVFWEAAAIDASPRDLAALVVSGLWTPYPEVNEILRSTGATPEMSERRLRQLFRPVADDVMRWVYDRFVTVCRERGIVPVWLYYPTVAAEDRESRSNWRSIGPPLAREAGFVVIELDDVFDAYDPEDLIVAPWDFHPNQLGHRLLADRFYEELLEHEEALGLRLATDPAPAPGR